MRCAFARSLKLVFGFNAIISEAQPSVFTSFHISLHDVYKISWSSSCCCQEFFTSHRCSTPVGQNVHTVCCSQVQGSRSVSPIVYCCFQFSPNIWLTLSLSHAISIVTRFQITLFHLLSSSSSSPPLSLIITFFDTHFPRIPLSYIALSHSSSLSIAYLVRLFFSTFNFTIANSTRLSPSNRDVHAMHTFVVSVQSRTHFDERRRSEPRNKLELYDYDCTQQKWMVHMARFDLLLHSLFVGSFVGVFVCCFRC